MAGRSQDESDISRRADQIIEWGVAIVGGTAAVGAGLALTPFAGPPVAIGVTAALRRVAIDLTQRVLTWRQAQRIEIAWDAMGERGQSLVEAGHRLRTDNFFTSEGDWPSPGEELLEGTLLHAANQYEERKVAWLGRLYAGFAFTPDLTAADANYFLKIVELLSYRQLVLLAIFGGDEHRHALTAIAAERSAGRRTAEPGVIAEVDGLANAGLLGIRQDGRWAGRAAANPTELGRRLYALMDLSEIPQKDQEAALDALGRRQ
jgi:hypothetical protein